MIEVQHLSKKYGPFTAVDDVSFRADAGEILGFLGPNGAGKTTSFYQVVGLVKPDEGEVFLGEMNITRMPMRSARKRSSTPMLRQPSTSTRACR